MEKNKCKHCGHEFFPTKKHKDAEFCSGCRKYHKNCEICDKEIFIQARTCSKQCAYELRKKSWKNTCGAEHNFSKESSSRKTWETKLFEEEGITNVFQREEVKEKIKTTHLEKFGVDHPSKSDTIKEKKKHTCLKNFGVVSPFCLTEKINDTMMKKYGKLRITNGEKISNTRRSDEFRFKMEEKGLWIPLQNLREWDIYRYNVWIITNQYVKQYLDTELFKQNKQLQWKDKISIDHKYSIYMGFKNKISPEIIGCIVNLELMSFSENSSKQQKCSISLHRLLNDYNNFINENKIN